MNFPIRVDLTQGEVLFYDADNELVTPEELVEKANVLNTQVDALLDELREAGERDD